MAKNETFQQMAEQLEQMALELKKASEIEIDAAECSTESEKLKQSVTAYLALSDDMSTDDTLNKLLKSAMHVVNAGGAGLTTYDNVKERLVFRAAIGDGAEGIIGYEVPLTGSQHGLAFATGEVQASAPIHTDIEEEAGAVFKNVLVAPLMVDGEAVGTISAVNKQSDGNFTPADMTAYLHFADVAAVLVRQKSREQLLVSLIEGNGAQTPEELRSLGLGESELELLELMRSIVQLSSKDSDMLKECRKLVGVVAGLAQTNSWSF